MSQQVKFTGRFEVEFLRVEATPDMFTSPTKSARPVRVFLILTVVGILSMSAAALVTSSKFVIVQ